MCILQVRCLVFLVRWCMKLMLCSRNLRVSNSKQHIASYSLRTSTGPLRYHLNSHHREVWIAACNKLGIQIKSLAVQGADGQIKDTGYPCKPFSNENFVDALGGLILGDDMVCRYMLALQTLRRTSIVFKCRSITPPSRNI